MDLKVALISLIVSTIAGCSVTIFRSEWESLTPLIAKRVLRIAIELLPIDQRVRLEEEWAALLADMPSPLTKLAAATGFCVAAASSRSSAVFEALRRRYDEIGTYIAIRTMLGAVVFVGSAGGTLAAIQLLNYPLSPFARNVILLVDALGGVAYVLIGIRRELARRIAVARAK